MNDFNFYLSIFVITQKKRTLNLAERYYLLCV